MSGAYLDLFDDEIESSARKSGSSINALADTVRLKMMLSILSMKTIAIPEQWAVSSSLFLSVSNEVINSYEHYRRLGGHPWIPLSLHFFRNDGETSTTNNPYINAMCRRLVEKNVRIKLCNNLDIEHDENAHSNRLLLVKVLLEAETFDERLEGDINAIICDIEISKNIVNLARYCENSDVNFNFQPNTYHHALRNHADKVKRFVCEDYEWIAGAAPAGAPETVVPIGEQEEEVILQFKQFFNMPEYKNLEGRYVELWRLARERFDPDAASFIERMGRIGMHNALGDVVGADVTSHAHGKFVGMGTLESFSGFFTNALLKNRGDSDAAIVAREFVVSEEGYIDIPWDEAWLSIWRIARDPEWNSLRQSLNIRIADADVRLDGKSESVALAALEEAVDFINTRARRVALSMDPSLHDQLGYGIRLRKLSSVFPTVAVPIPSLMTSVALETADSAAWAAASAHIASGVALLGAGFLALSCRRARAGRSQSVSPVGGFNEKHHRR